MHTQRKAKHKRYCKYACHSTHYNEKTEYALHWITATTNNTVAEQRKRPPQMTTILNRIALQFASSC